MSNKALYSTAAASALIAVCVLHFSSSDAQDAPAVTVDTTAAIKAAKWSDNVTITLNPEEQTFRYQSDGIPSTYLADAYLVPDDPSMMPLTCLRFLAAYFFRKCSAKSGMSSFRSLRGGSSRVTTLRR